MKRKAWTVMADSIEGKYFFVSAQDDIENTVIYRIIGPRDGVVVAKPVAYSTNGIAFERCDENVFNECMFSPYLFDEDKPYDTLAECINNATSWSVISALFGAEQIT